MLQKFKNKCYLQRASAAEYAQQPLNFRVKECDVRCLGHVINIAVQNALKQLKAVPSDQSEEYRMKYNTGRIPYGHRQDEIVSALSKLRLVK